MRTLPIVRRARLSGLLLLGLLFCAQGAWAMSVSPYPSTDGSYTVHWGAPVGDYTYEFTMCVEFYGCYTWNIPYYYELQEYNGSNWVRVNGLAEGATSKTYDGKATGTYHYRIWSSGIDCGCGLGAIEEPGEVEGPLTQVVLSPGVSTLPPVFSAVDGHGVDVATGAFTYSETDLVVGPPGAGGLSLTRTYLSTPFGYWTHNHNGYLAANGFTCSVVLGTFVETFTATQADCQGTFTSNQQRGATLSYSAPNYTYTTRDGTVVQFERYTATTRALNMPEGAALLKSITTPLGEVTTYTYEFGGSLARLTTVDNNFGYRLYFGYPAGLEFEAQPNLVRGINKKVEVCSPYCVQTWPTVTYYWTGWDLTSATNGNGATTNYYLTLNSALGYQLAEVQHPDNPDHDINVSYANGRVAGIDRGFGTWTYAYADNAGNRTTTVTAPDATTRVTVTSLASGRVLTERNELFNSASYPYETSYQYDGVNRLTRITQPEGNYTALTYDSRGNITETRRVAKTGSGLADLVTTAAYPPDCANRKTCNQPTSTTDARGYHTDYTYDETHGGVLTITAPAATGPIPTGDLSGDHPQTRFTYAQFQARYKADGGAWINGAPIWRLTETSACATTPSCADTSADKTLVRIDYPGPTTANNLLPTTTTARAGDSSVTSTTSMTYTDWGDPLTVNGPLDGDADTTRYYYDAGQRPIGVVGPDPDGAGVGLLRRAQRTTYNAIDQVTVSERGTVADNDTALETFVALEKQDMAYDAFGRLVRTRLWNGGTLVALSQINYDNRGRPLCTALRMNPNLFGSPPTDACGQGSAGGYGADRISRTLYDAAGRVTQQQSGVGITGLEQTTATTTYTPNGQVETLTDARNYRTTYVYDGFDRLKQRRYPAPNATHQSSTTDYEEYTYDTYGRLSQERRRSDQINPVNFTFSYDNLGRVTGRDAPGDQPDTAYAYDLLGRVTSASQPGNTLTTAYDALSRVTGVTSSVLGTVGYQYDAAGRRTQLTYPDNFHVNYDYLVTGEVQKLRENDATSGAGVLATFGYDATGRRTTLTRGNGVVTNYGYDAASRLQTLSQDPPGTTHDVTFSFTYNPAHQLTARTRSNDLYAAAPAGNASESYSANGLNQYTHAPGPNGTPIVPSYDPRGNLTGDGATTYAYDYDNRLVSATGGASLAYDPAGRLHQVSQGTAATRFLYDGADLIAEYDAAGTVQKRYVHGPGVDEPLVEYAGSGTTNRSYLLADERGSVIGIANSAGTVTQVNAYDEYGAPHDENEGRFQYTGQIWLSELGLYHYKARLYDPLWGRFLQTDPIGTAGGMNLYGYVGNDPINFTDPSGLISNMCWGGFPATSSGGCPPMAAFGSDELEEIWVIGQRPGYYCDYYCRQAHEAQEREMLRLQQIQDAIDQINQMNNAFNAQIYEEMNNILAAFPEGEKVMNICRDVPTHVLATQNPANIGKRGGFSGDTVGPILVTAGSAAIAITQWGGDKSTLRLFLSRIGGVTAGGQVFHGISDIIGSDVVKNVREQLMRLYSDTVLLELISGVPEGYPDNTTATYLVPTQLSCPSP